MNQKYQITVHMPTENDHTFQRETKWVTHSESNESCKIGRICKKKLEGFIELHSQRKEK